MFHEGYFDKTYYRYFQADKPIANVFAIHGFGGHCMWFDNAANVFNENKINFFSFDLVGFGQSKYELGTVDSYKDWIDCSRDTLKSFLYQFNVNKPVFVLGHSMGALISILLSKSVKTNGWILSVPGFEGYQETWPFVDFILPVLFKSIVKPNEKVQVPFEVELLTRNKETQFKVKKDPLRVVNPNVKAYKELYFLTLKAKLLCKQMTGPVFVLMAGDDKVCSNAATEKYFNEIKSSDKAKKVYSGFYHDLFIDFGFEDVTSDISIWIKEHLTYAT